MGLNRGAVTISIYVRSSTEPASSLKTKVTSKESSMRNKIGAQNTSLQGQNGEGAQKILKQYSPPRLQIHGKLSLLIREQSGPTADAQGQQSGFPPPS